MTELPQRPDQGRPIELPLRDKQEIQDLFEGTNPGDARYLVVRDSWRERKLEGELADLEEDMQHAGQQPSHIINAAKLGGEYGALRQERARRRETNPAYRQFDKIFDATKFIHIVLQQYRVPPRVAKYVVYSEIAKHTGSIWE